MWLVNKLSLWSKTKLDRFPIEAGIEKAESGSIGYVEVFEDYALALKDAGNPQLIKEVRYADKKEVY